MAQNTVGELRIVIRAALDAGIAPLEIKETIYHAVPYVGMARVRDCLEAANETLRSAGVALPTAGQSVVTAETRFDKGLALQRSLFGSHIDAGYASSPADLLHIQKFLSANCFGDYQTRPALDPATRELLTYSILISLGGLRTAGQGAYPRQSECRQRPRETDCGYHTSAAVHRLSADAQRVAVSERGCTGEIKDSGGRLPP